MTRIKFYFISSILLVLLIFGCTRDEIMLPIEPIDPVDTMSMDMMMMDTMMITFTLADNSDHTLVDNQDMLTPNVIITRSVAGGEIFNIAEEEVFTKDVSPFGTEWAPGRTADGVENLNFTSFRNSVGGTPRRSVGTELVAHLIEDDIYLNVTITAWSDQKRGGFEYIRS